MTDTIFFLNGEAKKVRKGTLLKDVLTNNPKGTSVVILKPASVSKDKTMNLRLETTAGDIVIELAPNAEFPKTEIENLRVHFEDKNAASFGPFPSSFVPAKESVRYERGEVCIGCGGYNSKNSYLTFSRREHMGDHGAAEGRAVIGRVIFGLGIMNRWKNGDRITKIESVFSSVNSSNAEVTDNLSFEVEDDMQIFSEIVITAEGYKENHKEIDCGCAESVEHMLFCLKNKKYTIDRTASTYIRDHSEGRLYVPQELQKPRRDGSVTVRTSGKSSGALYIYTSDVPSNSHHTRVGTVTKGIELARFAKAGSVLSVKPVPEIIDLRGMKLGEAVALAKSRGLRVMADNRELDRVVIKQEPGTTLEVLKEGKVSLYTIDLKDVIDVSFDYENAPISVDLFRRETGLKIYSVGTMPFIYNVDDEMYLFKPNFASNVNIIPENTPTETVPVDSLALTNDTRPSIGMAGVRNAENDEFGPTGEPFEGTNIIGKVIDMDKLPNMKEGTTVYIREVKK